MIAEHELRRTPLHPPWWRHEELTSKGSTSTDVLNSLSPGCSMFPLRKKYLKPRDRSCETSTTPTTPKHPPLYADGGEEPDPDEVPRHRREGPEEVLPQVGLLQGEVLVGLQAGGHLRQRVGVAFVQRLLPEVLILETGSHHGGSGCPATGCRRPFPVPATSNLLRAQHLFITMETPETLAPPPDRNVLKEDVGGGSSYCERTNSKNKTDFRRIRSFLIIKNTTTEENLPTKQSFRTFMKTILVKTRYS